MKKSEHNCHRGWANFADRINRADYQNMTFALLKNGKPFARLDPGSEKVCVGRHLAEALAKTNLPENEAKAWGRDLQAPAKPSKTQLAHLQARKNSH